MYVHARFTSFTTPSIQINDLPELGEGHLRLAKQMWKHAVKALRNCKDQTLRDLIKSENRQSFMEQMLDDLEIIPHFAQKIAEHLFGALSQK